jgi:hypothetical protein
MKRAWFPVAGCLCAISIAACSHSHAVAVTPGDRAACAQAAVAYSALNADNGGARPTATYRRAIAVATHAHNPKLSDAIADWMTAVIDPRSARPASDAAYTMEECRQIGVPLQLTAPHTKSPSSSKGGSGDSGDGEGSDD